MALASKCQRKQVHGCEPTCKNLRMQFHMRGVALERVTEYKYLGVWVPEGCNWHAHGQHVVCKMHSARGYWRTVL